MPLWAIVLVCIVAGMIAGCFLVIMTTLVAGKLADRDLDKWADELGARTIDEGELDTIRRIDRERGLR